jgi:hypothetical protein
MTDTYQPIYDAVRSRLSNGDIGQAIETAIREANLSHYVDCTATLIGYEVSKAVDEYSSPSAIYRPTLKIDGNQWCALYGENLQDGVAGFGDTPSDAMKDFDKSWRTYSAKVLP